MPKRQEQSALASDGRDGREPRLSPAARRLLWIVAYYALFAAAVILLRRQFPELGGLLESGRLRELAQFDSFGRSEIADAPSASTGFAGWSPGSFTLLALVGALATTLPLAWVYSLTRRKRGFQQSMVHTLILLPIAIAGMLVLIQNSLALAFSLAGVVAVLRFRNTLEDTKDGAYIFIATTIGISAAVGVLVVGIVTSVVFNVCVLALWWIDFARAPTPGIRGGLARLARLPKLAPIRTGRASASTPASPARLDEWTSDAGFAAAARAWRRQLAVEADHRAVPVEARANTTLRVHTVDPGASQPLVESVLGECAKRWELAGLMPGSDGRFTLDYVIRLRKDARAELVGALRERGAPQIVGIEFR
jgi:hypothetical protein